MITFKKQEDYISFLRGVKAKYKQDQQKCRQRTPQWFVRQGQINAVKALIEDFEEGTISFETP